MTSITFPENKKITAASNASQHIFLPIDSRKRTSTARELPDPVMLSVMVCSNKSTGYDLIHNVCRSVYKNH
jgi:hypothetical protein